MGLLHIARFESFFRKSGHGKAFGGSGWDELLIVPAWDLPGRISGFACLGRDGRIPQDLRFRYVNPRRVGAKWTSGDDHTHVEAGLFMLPALLGQPPGPFGDAVFALDCPIEAARLHIRHGAEHRTTLPLVASWEDRKYRTVQSWDLLHGRPAVFLPRAYTPGLFLQARRADGRIVPPLAPPARIRLMQGEPAAILRWAASTAVGWRTALVHALRTLPIEEASRLVGALRLPDWEAAEIAAAGDDLVRERLAPARRPPPGAVRLGARATEIRQRDDGWYAARGRRKRLTELTFSVDRIVYAPARAQVFYRGTVRYRGRSFPYTAPEAAWARGPLGWFRDFLAARGLGGLETAGHRGVDLVALARAFSDPEPVALPDAVGWDPTLAAFIFPAFRIAGNGQVIPHPLSLAELEPEVPCAGLGPFREPGEDDRTGLAPGDVAVLAALAAAVLAPAFGLMPARFALAGASRGRLLDAAAAAGCVGLSPRGAYPHRFPRLLGLGGADPRRPAARGLLAAPEATFAAADFAEAGPFAAFGGWGVIWGDSAGRLPIRLLPAYLRDLAGRRLVLPDGPGFSARVALDLAGWLGRPAPVAVGWPEDTAWRAGLLLAALHCATPLGFQEYDPATFDPRLAHLVGLDDGMAWVRHAEIERLFTARGLAAPTRDDLVALFAAAGLETAPRYSPCRKLPGAAWRLPLDWLSAALATFGIRLVSKPAGGPA